MILLFLHADTRLPERFDQPIRRGARPAADHATRKRVPGGARRGGL